MAIRDIKTLDEILELHAKRELVGCFRVSNELYHQSPGLSKSSLADVLESPKYYKWTLTNEPPTSDALILGSAYDCMLFEPERFPDLFWISKTQPRNPEKDKDGRWPVSENNVEMLREMAKEFRRTPLAMKLINGLTQLSFWATDPETGILLKVRPDVVIPAARIITDLKSAANITPKKFAYTLDDLNYDLQAAMALRVIDLAQQQSGEDFGFEPPTDFVFLAQEKSEPYDIAPYKIGPESLMHGDAKCAHALAKYIKCYESNEWHGVTGGKIMPLEIPGYKIKEGMEKYV